MSRINPWVQIFKPQPQALVRLFCFSFAGGGTQSFCKWHEYLPETIEVCAVRLPGRETRLREPAISELPALLDQMIGAGHLQEFLDKPFVFFGHSMGAIVAFEAARRLQAEQGRGPERLIVSGRVAPQRKAPRPPINGLAQDDFIEALRKLNGTPPEVLNDAGLMALIIPMLRADFSINENYVYREEPRLDTDIVAFGGLRDVETTRDAIDDWKHVTNGAFTLRMVPGDHFFIQSAQALFLHMVSIELFDVISRVSAGSHVAALEIL